MSQQALLAQSTGAGASEQRREVEGGGQDPSSYPHGEQLSQQATLAQAVGSANNDAKIS